MRTCMLLFAVSSLVLGLTMIGRPTAGNASACEPNDGALWNLHQIRLTQAWAFFGGCSVPGARVAVADTGVDFDHPDLVGQIGSRTDYFGLADAPDTAGHGTAVSGIIAAIRDNSVGIAGVSPNSTVDIYKIDDGPNPGECPFDNALRCVWEALNTGTEVAFLAAIRQAADNGAAAINVSLGFGDDWYEAGPLLIRCIGRCDSVVEGDGILERAIDHAASKGTIVVAAAGNQSNPCEECLPGRFADTHDNVITVASSNADGAVASHSRTGSWVTVGAPGGDPVAERGIKLLTKDGGDGEGYGTSFAAPHVTGLVSIIKAVNPDLSPLEIKNILRLTATPWSGPAAGAGTGIVNAERAVHRALQLDGETAIVDLAGCGSNVLPRNDDGSTGVVALPFTLNFFGNTYGALFVNNNGNVTFDSPLATYTPFGLIGTNRVIIAPFFADVDTRGAGSGLVTYGATTYGGRTAFCVNWVDVGYFGGHTDKLNSFQLLLVDRSDVNPGDFDIIMNYDQTQWETGDASGGSGGLGGAVARVGYSNGTTTSFELPGSGVSLYFLDSSSTGLIHNSRDSLQDGRYIYAVRSGGPPTGGSISGHVYASSASPGNALGGAFVQVCGSSGSCNTTTTNISGEYTVSGLAAGDYRVRAFPPGSSSLLPGEIGPLTLSQNETLPNQDIVLTGPTPPPPGTTVTSPHTSTSDGVPIVIRGQQVDFQTTGCSGGTATYVVLDAATVIHTGAMTEGPPGTYSATIPGLRPAGGSVEVRVTIDCPGSIPDETVDFDIIYIDPSGTVRTVGGSPIAGATVTLLRSDSSSGPFEVVPDGSGIMSLANRDNPDTTDAAGHFGWDVIAGYYIVRAQMEGCVSPADPGQAFVESAVLTIPPPVTDLDLRLDCGVSDSTPPTTTISLNPAAPNRENGWYVSPVTVTLTAQDDPAGSGVASTEYRLDGGSWQPYAGAFTVASDGIATVEARSTDNAGNVEDPPVSATVQIDQTAPAVNIVVPGPGVAVQDGVTLAASASDAGSGVADVWLYVREDDGGSGTPVGYEGLGTTHNTTTGRWERHFDSTALPDGYYVVLAKAEDSAGNEGWSALRHFSIRNWAVLELLPASESNKAGRTMPVKFSLRIAAAVDPAQPFVYNEDLTIKIYVTGNPGNVLQTSTYGDSDRDYRINGELYITNFKTLRLPKNYTADIWRHNALDFLVGSFGFRTVK